jgi:hypothetical protein
MEGLVVLVFAVFIFINKPALINRIVLLLNLYIFTFSELE